jgi:hypothetical protein
MPNPHPNIPITLTYLYNKMCQVAKSVKSPCIRVASLGLPHCFFIYLSSLIKPEVLVELVDLITTEPDNDVEEKLRYK